VVLCTGIGWTTLRGEVGYGSGLDHDVPLGEAGRPARLPAS
jgi:hypothetical protein